MTDSPVKLILTNNSTFIEGSVPYQALKKELSFTPENAFFMVQHAKAKRGLTDSDNFYWDGSISCICYDKKRCKCPIKKDGTHFPTGLTGKVIIFLKKYGIPYVIIDKRQKYEKELNLEMSEEFEKRDYHEDISEKAVKQERGIIKASTGSGKTPLGAYIIKKLGVKPFIFYVPSVDLLQQTADELVRFLRLNGSSIEVGRIGDGECDIKDVNVMTIQTAVLACGEKYVRFDDEENDEEENILENRRKDILELITSAKGIAIDETQHAACATCQVISDYSVSARYRYGLSATPKRDQADDILIDACFGKQIADINASFLINHPKKYLVKPYIYFIPVKQNTASVKGFTYSSIYKDAIVNNATRNNYIANIAKKMADQGRTVLILVKQIAHGNILNKLIPNSTFLHGQHSKKTRLDHLNKMRLKKSSITISSVIFDEGINVKSLDTLILAGSGRSSTRALQRVGRILRPYTDPDTGEEKKFSIVIDFEDHFKYLLSHSKARKKMYETEPEFVIDYMSM